MTEPDEPRWLNAEEFAAWLPLISTTVWLPAALDAQLQRDAGMTLVEYSVLSWLSMSSGRTARMSEIAARELHLDPGVGERRGVAQVGEGERVDGALTVDWSLAFFGQAPIGDMTTPGAISSLTRARATNWPRSLNTRTYCPSVMPRSSASRGGWSPSARPARASGRPGRPRWS
jgi:hypothetical protein